MTKWQLAMRLFTGLQQGSAALRTHDGKYHEGYVMAIQREDGSGSSFNVTLRDKDTGETRLIHVRTID